jgi:hypothetical protein
MVIHFREALGRLYPELAGKAFSGTRLCWWVVFIMSLSFGPR